MSRYRNRLPQLAGGLFLTDAGIETTLIFQDGFELPFFAAFDLFKDEKGTEGLARQVGDSRMNPTPCRFAMAAWRLK